MEKINDLSSLKDEQINEAKKIAAFEITKLVHGEDEANNAKQIAEELFEGIGVSENMPSTTISKEKLGINIRYHQ